MSDARVAWIALAAFVAAALACSSGDGAPPYDGLLPLGSWGGDSAGMTVGDSGMHLEIACTYGDVSGRVPVAANGTFSVSGSYMLRAYPVARLPPDPAQFNGQLNGSTVTVTVVVNDTAAHQSVTRGPVVMRLGGTPGWGPCPI